MATVGTNDFTLLDIASKSGDKGRVAIVNQLDKQEDIIADMPLVECNKVDAHESEVLTGLPKSYYAKFNKGTIPSKGTTAVISDGTAMLESRSRVDARLIDKIRASKGPEAAALRMFNSGRFHRESLAQQVATAILYGDVKTNPEQIAGLATRYSDGSAPNGRNIISYRTGDIATEKPGGGTAGTLADARAALAVTGHTSIWLINWGEMTCHGIYPEGMMGGFSQESIDKQTLTNDKNEEFEVYRELYKMTTGLALPDWRNVVRGSNILMSDLRASGTTKLEAANRIINQMIQMCEHLESNSGKVCFYMNKEVRMFLRLLLKADVKGGGGLTYENVNGQRVMMFDGYPVRISDSILKNEAGIEYQGFSGTTNTPSGITSTGVSGIAPLSYTKAIT